MKNKEIVIFLTAYSPRWNIIASKRIENLSRYVSKYFKTFIIAGIPKKISEKELRSSYDIGSAQLIEIPSIYSKPKPLHSNAITTHNGSINKFKKTLKIEALPLLEMFLPVSPGGFVLHDQNKFLKEVKSIVERYYHTSKIYIFASYGPSFIIKIASRIKRHFQNIELIIDFRDWAYKYYEGFLYNTFIYKYYTKHLLKNSDKICFVSKVMKEYYERKLYITKPTIFLPNGFDEKYFDIVENASRNPKKGSFKIVYTGSLHFQKRNPEKFLKALKLFIQSTKNIDTKFIYAGRDIELMLSYVKRYNLEKNFENKGFLDYKDALKLQKDADLLLLLAYTDKNAEIGRSIITGKFYEYLASGKPLLVIAPENWEMREVVEIDNTSKVVPNNVKNILWFLENFFENQKNFDFNKRKTIIEEFNYKNISKKLINFIRGDM